MNVLFSRFCFIILLSLFSAFSVTADDLLPDHIKGALCLVRADNQILIVDELITGQLSLPGGTITPGEPASIAAQRETWEEAGLAVTVGHVLGYTDGAVVFDCVSDSEIISFQHRNELGGFELPIWFAPHYGVEVSRAMLIEPNAIVPEQYRYPDEWGRVSEMFGNASEQPVTYVDELIGAAPKIHQAELSGIKGFQTVIQSLPAAVSNLILSTDQLLKPWLFIVVIPMVAWYFGRSFALKFGFTLVAVTLLSLIAHQGFGFPRPHAYIPSLKLVDSTGYSFPSLVATLWVSLGSLVIWKLKKLSDTKAWIYLAVGLVWITIFKTYSGSSFLSDIAMGAILGGLGTWHIVRLDSKPDVNVSELLSSKAIWWGLTLLTVILTVIWPLPTFTFWLAMLITISGTITLLKGQLLAKAVPFNFMIGVIALLLLINFLISVAGGYIAYSGIGSLIVETVRFPLLILIGCVAVKASNKTV